MSLSCMTHLKVGILNQCGKMWEVKSHWTVTLIDESNDLYSQLMVAIN